MGREAEMTGKSILVVHPGALGDVLLSLPALRALRAAYPRHKLIFVATAELGEFLKRCGEVDEAVPLEGSVLATVLSGSGTLDSSLLSLLKGIDLAVCWFREIDERLRTVLRSLGVRRVVLGSPHAPENEGIHQSERFLWTLREIIQAAGNHGGLQLSRGSVAEVHDGRAALGLPPGKSLVVVHPGSGSHHKCTRPKLFAEIIGWLQGKDANPVIIEGPADEKQVDEVVRRCSIGPPVFRGLELSVTAEVIARADLYLGHDSGLTHLAAALDVPTVALFGPTDRRRWAPRGTHVTVLSGTPCLCGGWTAVQACHEKPCLQIPLSRVRRACESVLLRAYTEEEVRHTSCSGCSPVLD